ncbi:prohormone-1-like [Cherax quadricarinatus]|uniref:Allatostatin C1/prohormone 1 n=1 Tax=Cherax quadricarinatus TaxID=27406 RepID=A0A2U8JAD1_CHEQU|nr:allatostatin C1/prohormone 1 [Cherax quadricarinatus]
MLTRCVSLVTVALLALVAVSQVSGKALPDQSSQAYPEPQHMLDPYGNHLVDDDGSLDAALINYLFAKQMVERLRNNADIKDLQRKRSYWKQCAFNAVSCFGKRK